MQHLIQKWHVPYLSFFSRDLYRDVAVRWTGSGLGYLFLLLCVTSIPLTFQLAGALEQIKVVYMQHVIDKLPPLQIEQGVLTTDVPQPYVIRLPEMEEPFMVIDTRGTPAGEDEFQAPVVLQADRMIIDNQGEVRSYPFENISQFTLDKAELSAWLDKVMGYVKPLAYLPVLASEFIYRALQAVIYAVGGLVFATWLKVRLPYGVLLRLTCVALTPSLLLGVLVSWLGINFGLLGLVLFLVSQGYLFFAIQSVARQAGNSTPDDILVV